MKCTRLFEFDAAHRLMGNHSKCSFLHGHRYKVEVEATAQELDESGFVIDFAILKLKIGTWIDENWDHNTIICKEDVALVKAIHSIPKHRAPFIMPWNPTAENMARFLFDTVCPQLLKNTGVIVSRVRVWETPNCFAEVQ